MRRRALLITIALTVAGAPGTPDLGADGTCRDRRRENRVVVGI